MSDDILKQIAAEIAAKMWIAFGPEVEKIFLEKLINGFSRNWGMRWQTSEWLTNYIDKAVENHLETTFKSALEELARRKAREKVKQRAKANKQNPETLPGMAMDGEGKNV